MFAKLIEFFKKIFTYDDSKAREAYLSKATDIFDLEARMKELDQKRNSGFYY